MAERAQQVFEARDRFPGERSAFVAHACARDPALRSEVESLLGALDRAADFLGERERAGEGPGSVIERHDAGLRATAAASGSGAAAAHGAGEEADT